MEPNCQALFKFKTSLPNGQNRLPCGTFTKLQKATISFVMSACLSVRLSIRMEQLCSHWTDFHEI